MRLVPNARRRRRPVSSAVTSDGLRAAKTKYNASGNPIKPGITSVAPGLLIVPRTTDVTLATRSTTLYRHQAVGAGEHLLATATSAPGLPGPPAAALPRCADERHDRRHRAELLGLGGTLTSRRRPCRSERLVRLPRHDVVLQELGILLAGRALCVGLRLFRLGDLGRSASTRSASSSACEVAASASSAASLSAASGGPEPALGLRPGALAGPAASVAGVSVGELRRPALLPTPPGAVRANGPKPPYACAWVTLPARTRSATSGSASAACSVCGDLQPGGFRRVVAVARGRGSTARAGGGGERLAAIGRQAAQVGRTAPAARPAGPHRARQRPRSSGASRAYRLTNQAERVGRGACRVAVARARSLAARAWPAPPAPCGAR